MIFEGSRENGHFLSRSWRKHTISGRRLSEISTISIGSIAFFKMNARKFGNRASNCSSKFTTYSSGSITGLRNTKVRIFSTCRSRVIRAKSNHRIQFRLACVNCKLQLLAALMTRQSFPKIIMTLIETLIASETHKFNWNVGSIKRESDRWNDIKSRLLKDYAEFSLTINEGDTTLSEYADITKYFAWTFLHGSKILLINYQNA